MEGDVVTVERVIPAPPEKIFALLADASRHAVIDGSGSVRGPRSGTPQQLTLGSTFGMSMKVAVPYSMVNTVVEYEPNRRIAWEPRFMPRAFGRLEGGRIWRYELEPVEGGTRVRESWDISHERLRPFLRKGKVVEQTRANMEKTLEKIAAIVS
ncbi:MAG TPA: SRPBCC family protein [Acidimicrobiales bacterium]|nr:SRPBCC family protein [Acidimicrobiales bacterium]